MGAAVVGKLLSTCQSLLNIREFTDNLLWESLLGVVGPQENCIAMKYDLMQIFWDCVY